MLEAFYSAYKEKWNTCGLFETLTLTMRRFSVYLFNEGDMKNYKQGEDYVNFRPDRVAIRDDCPDGIASIHECRKKRKIGYSLHIFL